MAPAKLTRVADLTGTEDYATGYYAVAALRDGTLRAWGSAANHAIRELPLGLTRVTAVAGGRNFCLALLDNGNVIGWGGGDGAQAAAVPKELANVRAIAAGGHHALALKVDGTVTAWGNNYEGQCDVPAGLNDVVGIAAGMWMSGALKRDGTVVCWGQTLDGTTIETPAWISGATKLAAGDGNFLVVTANGRAETWGKDWDGQPVKLPSDRPPLTDLAGGSNTGVGLRRNGRLYAFDAYHPMPRQRAAQARVISAQFYIIDRAGRLRAGGPNAKQLALHGRSRAKLVSAGHWHSMAALTSDRLLVAGERRYEDRRPQRLPAKAPGVRKIVSGQNFDVGLLVDGTVAAVGFAKAEQPPEGLAGVIDVDAGNNHAIALKNDGTVVTWGRRSHIGERLDVPAELLDPATARIKAVAATAFSCVALQEGGRLFVWGGAPWENPLEFPDTLPDDIVDLEAGDQHLIGLRANGKVLAWGDNGAGQIEVPAGLTSVTALAAGGRNSLALKQDGTVVAWGAERTVPVGLTNVTAISCGPYHALALVGEPPAN